MLPNNHKAGFPEMVYPVEISGISPVIETYEKEGWHLRSYAVSFCPNGGSLIYSQGFYHFLLFDREKKG